MSVWFKTASVACVSTYCDLYMSYYISIYMRSQLQASKVWTICLSSPLQGVYLRIGLLFKVKVRVLASIVIQTQLCFSQSYFEIESLGGLKAWIAFILFGCGI